MKYPVKYDSRTQWIYDADSVPICGIKWSTDDVGEEIANSINGQASLENLSDKVCGMRPEFEIEYLKDQIKKICKEFYDFFEDKPDDSGVYLHLGICSASNRKPIGADGCVCKSSAIFRRSKNPHDWVLTESTRIPERGLNWDNYECSKCKWTKSCHTVSLTAEDLNKFGWCPVFSE